MQTSMWCLRTGAKWSSFQLTALIHDVDEAKEKPCRIVWRGTSSITSRITNYGHFVRKG